MLKRSSSPYFFNGANTNQMLRNLEHLESESGFFQNVDCREKPVFFDNKRQMVICSYVHRLGQLKIWAGAILGKRSFKRIYNAIGTTRVNAHRIRVNYNLIAFYPDRNMICKFRHDSSVESIDRIHNEGRALKAAQNLDFIKVPKVLLDQSKTDSVNVPAIWIEHIKGKRPSRDEIKNIACKYAEVLLLWYEHHGIDYLKPSTLFPNYSQNEKITANKLLSYGWDDVESLRIMEAYDKILQCKMVMPVSWLHGDAIVLNCMINERGELVIIDWENSRKGFIVEDLLKLAHYGGSDIKQLYNSWLKNRTSNHSNLLDVDMQFDIEFLMRNINIKDKERYLISKMSLKKSYEAVQELKQLVLSKTQNICKSL